jgi:hypothetical protein
VIVEIARRGGRIARDLERAAEINDLIGLSAVHRDAQGRRGGMSERGERCCVGTE